MNHVPQRTCIGCRRKESSGALLRLGICEGKLQVLGAGPSRGRGAWLHPAEACVQAAVKTRAFARAFRGAVAVPDIGELLAAVAPGATPFTSKGG